MKKIVFCCSLFVFSLPLIGISQEKPVQSEDKGSVVVTGFARKKPIQSEDKGSLRVLTQKQDAPMILYVINGRYYLGDTTDIPIRRMDVSKVKKIEEIKDEETMAKYSQQTGTFSKQVQGIFVIETDEKFDPSVVIPK